MTTSDCNIILIKKLERSLKEYKEQTFEEIISKYNFFVGSEECKNKLKEVLPEGANIICSSYWVWSPTTVYVIKKFDPTDYCVKLP